MNLRLSILFLILVVSCGSIKANDIYHHSLSVDFRPQWVIPTNNFIKESNINSAIGGDLKYSFSFSPNSFYGRNYPAARQGAGIGYTNIAKGKKLGNPLNFYLFQNVPVAKLTQRLSLIYEWNFGISLNWNPYHPDKNPDNGAIGSKANAYINLGLLLRYRLNRNVDITAGIDGTHYSNGNTTIPNAGANFAGIRLGVSYTFDSRAEIPLPVDKTKFERGMGYDLTVYGAARRRAFYSDSSHEYLYARGLFGVLGLNFAPMYGFSRYFRAGVSLDTQYDESANILNHRVEGTPDDDMKFYRPPFKEQIAVGLSLRAELVMPVFSINVGIGRNIICDGKDTDIFYQTLTLKAYLWRNAFLNIGYQLNDFHEPNNLMLGFGYSFGMKR
ncbi:MAG: acyloxyacyl hydrolase [Lachnospiraceae bacterium]|nr:acyloxyacyl hydrolase [Lachnospiraceae bacterium]